MPTADRQDSRVGPVFFVLLGVLGLLSAALGQPVHAQAEEPDCAWAEASCSGADPGDGSLMFGARVVNTEHLTSGEQGPSGPGVPACTFRAADASVGRGNVHDPTGIPIWAAFYWMDCGDRTYLRWYVSWYSDPVTDGLLTEAVQAAFDTIRTQRPVLRLSPSADSIQLTGMRTWLAIDPGSFRRIDGSVSAGEVTVSAWLEPHRVEWRLGNGDTRTCEGPGNVYEPGVPPGSQAPACSYTYLSIPAAVAGPVPADVFPLSAQVVYRAGYRVSGPIAPGVYALPEILGPIAATSLRVQELWAVRVGG